MWLMTQNGFVSIVEKPEDVAAETLTVRSRDRQSLENFAKAAGIPVSDVKEKTETDYPFRLVTTRDRVAKALMSELDELRYPNFKNQAKKRRGHTYASFLGRVWSAGWSLTPRDVQKRSDEQFNRYLKPARQGTGKKGKGGRRQTADDYLDEIRWGTLPDVLEDEPAGAPNHHEHEGFESPYEPITEDDWKSIMEGVPGYDTEIPNF